MTIRMVPVPEEVNDFGATVYGPSFICEECDKPIHAGEKAHFMWDANAQYLGVWFVHKGDCHRVYERYRHAQVMALTTHKEKPLLCWDTMENFWKWLGRNYNDPPKVSA